MKRLAAAIAAMVCAYAFAGSILAASPEQGAAAGDAKVCVTCHDKDSGLKVRANHGECQSCHGASSEHAKAPMSAKPDRGAKPEGQITSQTCLSCHAEGKGHARDSARMNFAFSEHAKGGVECANCHGIHEPKLSKQANVGNLKMDPSARLCASCHQDILARFSMTSRHPVKEGAVACKDCHNPHDSRQLTLGAKTEQCTQCHQAVRGPHVFEHPPVAEDCTNCHNPHGSPNRRLLEVAQPMQCLQCHSLPNNRHGETGSNAPGVLLTQRISGAALRNCTSCHAAIHGSAGDQHLRH